MFFSDLKDNPYKLINVIFAIIILAIFIYSASFSPEKTKYPIPSESKWLLNQDSLSTGLSRSFSSIIRFNYADAGKYNPLGFQIFMFFVIQFFLRIFFLFAVGNLKDLGLNIVISIDSIISGSLFILFFMPFFKDLV